MEAMEHVGKRFGEGKMFLPQVVKAAKVMRDAVDLLTPYLSSLTSEQTERPVIITATANGDVHDIGKNIVGIVLRCNGFDVHDLGVMVPAEKILEETLRLKPCLVGISGLITPSLKEMEKLCLLFQREGLTVPINVGGATTSALHTAVKLAPLYPDGCVVYGGDASRTAVLAKRLQVNAAETIAEVKAEQRELREAYDSHHTAPLTSYAEANARAPRLAYDDSYPSVEDMEQAAARVTSTLVDGINIPLTSHPSPLTAHPSSLLSPLSPLTSLIDWRMFLLFWGFKGETLPQLLVNPEAAKTLEEGKRWLAEAVAADRLSLKVLLRVEAATRRGNDIVLADGSLLPMLRSQSETVGRFRCLSDFFDEQRPRPLVLFTIVAAPKEQLADEQQHLMAHAVCARLAEAAAEWLQSSILKGLRSEVYSLKSEVQGLRSEVQGPNSEVQGLKSEVKLQSLRPAFGYASCPDHSLKRIVFDRLQAEQRLGVTLTDHYAIQPSTSICGMILSHPDARYFPVGRIDRDQLADYCRRRGITEAEGEELLSKYLS